MQSRLLERQEVQLEQFSDYRRETPASKMVAGIRAILILSLALYSNGQESCQTTNANGGGFVGFTALTPEQLKGEIRTSIEGSVSKLMDHINQTLKSTEASCSMAIEDLNLTILSALSAIVEVNQNLEQTLISSITTRVEEQIKSAVEEIIKNLTRIDEPDTVKPPTTGTLPTTGTPPTTETPIATTESTPATETTSPLPTPPPIGTTPRNPATSCKQIFEQTTAPPSGLYWLLGKPAGVEPIQQGSPVQVYCDMERTCGQVRGGWMQVANITMLDSRQTCPTGFRVTSRSEPPHRLCNTNAADSGCFGTTFPTNGIPYSRVCGMVIGYQDGTPNAFYNYYINPSLTINEAYIDGVSLTHGSPRNHIWSFVAALDETDGHLSGCECSNIDANEKVEIPPFIGSDYFCDTGSRDDVGFELYDEDPLWNGKGCGPKSTCCTFNEPPWFSKELPTVITDNIELRVCRDSRRDNEDTPLEIVEIYVR